MNVDNRNKEMKKDWKSRKIEKTCTSSHLDVEVEGRRQKWEINQHSLLLSAARSLKESRKNNLHSNQLASTELTVALNYF